MMRLAIAIALVATTAASAQEADFGGLPEGEGRLETFANCISCHSTLIIRQQRLSRRTWDDVLDWMVNEKGMWVLPPETREKVLDYLSEQFGSDVPRS